MANLRGFFQFLRNFAQIPCQALPDNSPYPCMAYAAAVDIVNLQLQTINCQQYDWAVYNLATDSLINWCPDQRCSTYFTDARKAFGLSGNLVAGLVASTADEGTSMSLTVPEILKEFGFQDLLTLRTPFGREYMALAGRCGSLWGLS